MEARQGASSRWLQVCVGQRAPGEPDDREIRDIEGWILSREFDDALAIHTAASSVDAKNASGLAFARRLGRCG
jgi:hypothetical protein